MNAMAAEASPGVLHPPGNAMSRLGASAGHRSVYGFRLALDDPKQHAGCLIRHRPALFPVPDSSDRQAEVPGEG